jgi:hypothetical protein
MVLFWFLSDPLRKLRQQPRGVLDLASDGFAVLRWLFRTMECTAGDGDDLIEIAFQRCFCRLPLLLLLLRFQKQFRLGENPLARLLGSCLAPGVVQQSGFARGPVLLGEDLRHALALFPIDARHRSQIAHSDLRADASFADLLLHRFRQCFDQRQTPRHPCRAAIETPRQFLDRAVKPAFHLLQQPALFDRRFRLAVHAQRTHQQQCFGLAHLPYECVDCVAPQLLERGDALMAIDHQIALLVGDDDDWRLLAGLSQRRQQMPESCRVADPEMLQAAVQLMKLQCLRHGFQYARAGIWSFAAEPGCCPEAS